MAEYDILIQTPTGSTFGSLKTIHRCAYARTENDAGEMTLVVPNGIYDPSWFAPFNRILVMRSVGGSVPVADLDTPWIIVDGPFYSLASDGTQLVTFGCMDALGWICGGANVAYNDYNSYTYKLDEADDMMKAIMRENRGTLATDTTRSLAGYLDIAGDGSAAPIIRFGSFARQQVLQVLKDIANASANDNTPTWLGFDIGISDLVSGLLEFRTYVGQRGNDHRFPTGSPPILLSPNLGQLGDIRQGTSYKEAASFIYAGASAVGDIRAIATDKNDIFISRSPFARVERYVDGGQITDPIALANLAHSSLREFRPKNSFEAELLEVNSMLRGVQWDYGDYLTAEWASQTYDVRASKISVTLEPADGGGLIETSKVQLRGEESTSG